VLRDEGCDLRGAALEMASCLWRQKRQVIKCLATREPAMVEAVRGQGAKYIFIYFFISLILYFLFINFIKFIMYINKFSYLIILYIK
jgi:hypothetical protein